MTSIPTNDAPEYKPFSERAHNIQSRVKGLIKDTDGFNYKYQTLDDLLAILRPELEKENMVWCASTALVLDEHGEMKETSEGFVVFKLTVGLLDIPTGRSLASAVVPIICTTPQKIGGQITYLKRYSLMSLLGLTFDVDTDASDMRNGYPKPDGGILGNLSKNISSKDEEMEEW